MYYRIGDIEYYVEQVMTPDSGTVVVFLHGFGGSGEVFNWISQQLNDSGISTVLIDLPGHGKSKAPLDPDLYNIQTQRNHLIGLFEAMKLDSPWLYGYSMGGRIALNIATQTTLSLSGLILESAQLGISDADDRKARIESDIQLASKLRNDPKQFFQMWNRLPLFRSSNKIKSEETIKFESIQVGQNINSLALTLEYMSPGRSNAIKIDELDQLPYPVMVLTGSEDLKYDAMWYAISERYHKIEHLQIPEAGHRIHMDQPRILSKELIHYIKSKTYK
jgi:2-succinyl-6-hydroxy-2,4-cyclohexadiene-1-carboxylate synthase